MGEWGFETPCNARRSHGAINFQQAMPDPTILNQAAHILAATDAGHRADRALQEYFNGRRHGSWKERRDITRAVFAYFRWLGWLDRKTSAQRRLAQALELQERFDRDPDSIKDEALAALAVPAWLKDEVVFPPAHLRLLQREQALWLRARPGRRAELAAALGECRESERAPDALRYLGDRDLFQTPEFRNGAFEIQDLASQLVGVTCAPNPGESWWDACAGEGGKTLHLADLMGNKGVVWASDRSERRLEVLRKRAARAKLHNYRVAPWDGGPKPPHRILFDGILVDAPCSGVGTWGRNPHARWTTDIRDVAELSAIQASLLRHAAPWVRHGGKLVYSVCTLTRSETTAVADAFAAAHAEFTEVSRTVLRPEELDSSGMFVAVWKRA
jgi:16S rRNA (cytosine967-C5)-methyltransferase